jgi:hypothetical protein
MAVDTELLVQSLRKRGHVVNGVIPVPDNAGDFEFVVDGVTMTLVEARALLELDQAENPRPVRPKAEAAP